MLFATDAWSGTDSERAVAIGQSQTAEGSILLFEQGQNGKQTRWDINDLNPQPGADTFFIFPPTNVDTNDTWERKNRLLHPGIVYFPTGFPIEADSVKPWKYWLIVTTMAGGEVPCIYVTNDITDHDSWTNKWGDAAGDTFVNPIITAKDASMTQDSLFWYHNGAIKAYYDTGSVGGADSVTLNMSPDHLSDCGITSTFDGKFLAYWRASYTHTVEMSCIYGMTSPNAVDWGDVYQLTHLGKWMSPAIVQDTGLSYSMYCTAQKDTVGGRPHADSTFWKCTSASLTTFFDSSVACTLLNFANRGYPWHMSVWAPAYDQQFALVNTRPMEYANNIVLFESHDRGIHWTASDVKSVILKGTGTRWDARELYQASMFGIDEGSHLTLGVVYSARRDSSGTAIWHTGYKEVPLIGATPWVGNIIPGHIMSHRRANDSVRCIFPYFTGTDNVLLIDTALKAVDDSVAMNYVFETRTYLDSINYWYKGSTTRIDSVCIMIPKMDSLWADSVSGYSTGNNITATLSWKSRSHAIGRFFNPGQAIAMKLFFDHAAAGNWVTLKRMYLYGKKY